MDLNFANALATIDPADIVRVANESRPPANYIFSTFLPERLQPDYNVSTGSMTVRATMAGLTAMDSPYPPGGVIETSKFLSETAKIAIEVPFNENSLRKLQAMIMANMLGGAANGNATMVNEALNFTRKVVVQAHLDRAEWLRGQALVNGVIAWTFGNAVLNVDYGIPATHMLPERTLLNDDAYGDTDSAFWTDVATARRLLRYNLRAVIAHPDTIDEIVTNSVNAIEVLSQTNSRWSIRRLIERNGNTIPTSDARETLTMISYGDEAEIFDPSNPGQTTLIPFMPRGKLLFVANNRRTDYRVGEGSTADPDNDLELGYHHIAPTVENGGRPGRWAQLWTPQDKPYQLLGRGVENSLPVIEAPDKIVVATTELAA